MRKLAMFAVMLSALLGVSGAYAQNIPSPPTFGHIIIIIQENRTPDNLFGAGPSQTSFPYGGVDLVCGNPSPFEMGVDIDNGGPINFINPPQDNEICLTEMSDNTAPAHLAWNEGGGDHTHIPDWVTQYDSGNLDGACYASSNPPCGSGGYAGEYPPYTYMAQGLVQPYFDIATHYGFANYMFSTHEGPSFPAHQFLFSGTSAPVWPGDSENYYQDFVSENPSKGNDSGCPATAPIAYPKWVKPNGTEKKDPYSRMCYDHNTLVTTQAGSTGSVSDNGISWSYYAQLRGSIWDAPEANPQICYGLNGPPPGNPPYPACTNTYNTGLSEWNHVALANQPSIYGYTYSSAPIFDDIKNCNLPQISWVTPDEAWSDHPDDRNTLGNKDKGYGPSWVADIVDAIGNSNTYSHGACDYWSADPTAIFIVWDDWGGFYDHVPPPAVYQADSGYLCTTTENPPPNLWGCGYVFGFRVPLLVASKYTNNNFSGGSGPYVSGYVSSYPPTYPPPAEYTHDFGSILAFIENNFSPKLGPIAPQVNGYTYADQNSLDYLWCKQYGPCTPLWDFFQGAASGFTNISAPQDACFFQCQYLMGGTYEDCTCNTEGSGATPVGPDEGADDPN
jgi:phospholipase C